ncbi:MAG TPA: hypothetical protein VMT99_03705 [Candidatus Paceibacterota bacterium]|nr:hypothetical protein [Candidatus Paceibacterota bacterium]
MQLAIEVRMMRGSGVLISKTIEHTLDENGINDGFERLVLQRELTHEVTCNQVDFTEDELPRNPDERFDFMVRWAGVLHKYRYPGRNGLTSFLSAVHRTMWQFNVPATEQIKTRSRICSALQKHSVARRKKNDETDRFNAIQASM